MEQPANTRPPLALGTVASAGSGCDQSERRMICGGFGGDEEAAAPAQAAQTWGHPAQAMRHGDGRWRAEGSKAPGLPGVDGRRWAACLALARDNWIKMPSSARLISASSYKF